MDEIYRLNGYTMLLNENYKQKVIMYCGSKRVQKQKQKKKQKQKHLAHGTSHSMLWKFSLVHSQ